MMMINSLLIFEYENRPTCVYLLKLFTFRKSISYSYSKLLRKRRGNTGNPGKVNLFDRKYQ